MMAITTMTIIETKDKILKCLLLFLLLDSPFSIISCSSRSISRSKSVFDNHLNLVYLYGHFDVYSCYYYLLVSVSSFVYFIHDRPPMNNSILKLFIRYLLNYSLFKRQLHNCNLCI